MQGTRTVGVRFADRGTRSGPLTLGQGNMLRVALDNPGHDGMAAVLALPEGVSVDRVAGVLAELLARHEPLRTTYVLGKVHLGEVHRQVVAPSGELTLSVHEASSDDAPLVAQNLRRELLARPFDLERDLPWRVAVVASGDDTSFDTASFDTASFLVVAVSHVAADAQGVGILIGEAEDLIAGRELPPIRLQPLDLVEIEQEPHMRRRAKAAVEYWRDQIYRAPHSLFPADGRYDGDAEADSLVIRSTAIAEALDKISRRSRVSKSALVLTAMAALVGYRAGQTLCPVTTPSANRSLPELQGFLGTLAMDAFMALDFGGAATFDQAARKTGKSALRAYWNSCFDSAELWKAIKGAGDCRGIDAYSREFVFNDMSAAGPSLTAAGWAGPPPPRTRSGVEGRTDGRSEGRADGSGTTFSWFREQPFAARLTLFVYSLDGEFVATMWRDPRYVPTAEVLAFGHGVARLLIEAADDDIELAGLGSLVDLKPVEHGPGWYPIDSGWIASHLVENLLAEVLGGQRFFLDVIPSDVSGYELVCYVVDEGGGLTSEGVHRACLSALPGRASTMAPHFYVVCDAVPSGADADINADAEAWRGLPYRSRGTGRSVP